MEVELIQSALCTMELLGGRTPFITLLLKRLVGLPIFPISPPPRAPFAQKSRLRGHNLYSPHMGQEMEITRSQKPNDKPQWNPEKPLHGAATSNESDKDHLQPNCRDSVAWQVTYKPWWVYIILLQRKLNTERVKVLSI